MTSSADWPELALESWRDTYATLHRWTQIVGKTRLALSPRENHWWHVALYLTPRGLTTAAIPTGPLSFDVEFDFVGHELRVRTTRGGTGTIPLAPQSVRSFYRKYLELLGSLGIDLRIRPVPSELPPEPSFLEDDLHAAYDPDAAHRCWRLLAQADRLLKRFRGRFLGKSSPSHFWWGGFDLACTRFSGRPAPRHPGGIPYLSDRVTVEAYSHECISAGFWMGTPGSPVEEPCFYAYAYPEPPGCPEAPLLPLTARYHPAMHEWILPRSAVASENDPDSLVLEFLETTYSAAARLGGWDRVALDRPPSEWP
jgi:hypothetical protein